MTQSLKTQEYKLRLKTEYNINYLNLKNRRQRKTLILNYLFRHVLIITKREKIRAIPQIRYKEMSSKLNIDVTLIHSVVSKFLVDLVRIKDCMNKKGINKSGYILYSKNQSRLVRSYLHKFHRLAPVFDYKRARENSRILKIKLDELCFRPIVTTQLAIIIYI